MDWFVCPLAIPEVFVNIGTWGPAIHSFANLVPRVFLHTLGNEIDNLHICQYLRSTQYLSILEGQI